MPAIPEPPNTKSTGRARPPGIPNTRNAIHAPGYQTSAQRKNGEREQKSPYSKDKRNPKEAQSGKTQSKNKKGPAHRFPHGEQQRRRRKQPRPRSTREIASGTASDTPDPTAAHPECQYTSQQSAQKKSRRYQPQGRYCARWPVPDICARFPHCLHLRHILCASGGIQKGERYNLRDLLL